MSTTHLEAKLLVNGQACELTSTILHADVDYIDVSGPARFASTRKDSHGHEHRWGKTGLPETAAWEDVPCNGSCGDSGCDGWTVAVCATCGDELDIPTRHESRTIAGRVTREAKIEMRGGLWPTATMPRHGDVFELLVPGYRVPCELISFQFTSDRMTMLLAITGPEIPHDSSQ